MCVIEEIATIETETIDLKGCRVWEMTCQAQFLGGIVKEL